MFTSIKSKLAPVFAALFVVTVYLLNSPITMAACGSGASGGCAV